MVGCLLRPRALVLQQHRHPAAFAWLSQISFSATKSAPEMAPECRCKNHGPFWMCLQVTDFKRNKLVGAAGFEPTTPTPPDKRLFIEYDGQHHFMPVNFGGMSDEKALAVHNMVKERDKRKDKWATENNYMVLRIRYDQDVNEALSKYFS